ncbi:hypothetical protein ACJX0J_027388, partial [Zea mays]
MEGKNSTVLKRLPRVSSSSESYNALLRPKNVIICYNGKRNDTIDGSSKLLFTFCYLVVVSTVEWMVTGQETLAIFFLEQPEQKQPDTPFERYCFCLFYLYGSQFGTLLQLHRLKAFMWMSKLLQSYLEIILRQARKINLGDLATRSTPAPRWRGPLNSGHLPYGRNVIFWFG